MSYTVIGLPHIEPQYSDEYETTMVVDLAREDGVEGDVWIVAGVPDYQRGSSDAARTQRGYQDVRVFGDCLEMWCPENFRVVDDDGNWEAVCDEIIDACRDAALKVHRAAVIQRAQETEVREFVASHKDDDEMDADELERIFLLAYDREPDDSDRETGLWSLICAAV